MPDCLDTQFDLVASSSSIPLIRLYAYKGLTITNKGLWVTMLVKIANGELDDVHEHEKKYDQLWYQQSLVSLRHAREETIENDLAYAMNFRLRTSKINVTG